ncbi:MAG: phosphotriesterase-related protein [Chloroflexi bacterium]|nr:phosphotriesterase-related protein [Chloroflexota bacterium]
MADNRLKGMVQTVLGPVSPAELGPTMTHEHLLIDFLCMFNPPPEATARARAEEPITLENLGWVRYNSFSNRDNLLLGDEETAIEEASLYKRAGGGTIVDATTIGIGRDPLALARIARATGLNVVMGAGYYVDAVHPEGMDALAEPDIAAQIVADITQGVGDTGVRAGIIGEIGCTWPLTANERKVLRAAASAQRETGAAILIHPGRSEAAPREILDVLAESGADVGRTIMGHLDRTVANFDTLMDLASSGCYLEWDLFGNESSYYPLSDISMPSDAQRIDVIAKMVAEGYGERIVVAHDVCTKHRLVRYGGHGYGHIVENIVPRMRQRLSAQEVDAIVVQNPARILTIV